MGRAGLRLGQSLRWQGQDCTSVRAGHTGIGVFSRHNFFRDCKGGQRLRPEVAVDLLDKEDRCVWLARTIVPADHLAIPGFQLAAPGSPLSRQNLLCW